MVVGMREDFAVTDIEQVEPCEQGASVEPPEDVSDAGLPAGIVATSPWGRLASCLLEGLLLIVTLGIGWLIWAAMIAPTGQTPAKKLLGQRVIRADTIQPAGFARMFWIRWILAGLIASFAIVFTLGVLLFMPFWDRRSQNLWDKISNTYVVNDPNDHWQTRPALPRA